ncbi:MAG: hypothetical protein LBT84_05120 [Spirochaetia bacterium]|nr:hypothetical protein [Spirochaetia bacterium]
MTWEENGRGRTLAHPGVRARVRQQHVSGSRDGEAAKMDGKRRNRTERSGGRFWRGGKKGGCHIRVSTVEVRYLMDPLLSAYGL